MSKSNQNWIGKVAKKFATVGLILATTSLGVLAHGKLEVSSKMHFEGTEVSSLSDYSDFSEESEFKNKNVISIGEVSVTAGIGFGEKAEARSKKKRCNRKCRARARRQEARRQRAAKIRSAAVKRAHAEARQQRLAQAAETRQARRAAARARKAVRNFAKSRAQAREIRRQIAAEEQTSQAAQLLVVQNGAEAVNQIQGEAKKQIRGLNHNYSRARVDLYGSHNDTTNENRVGFKVVVPIGR